MFQLGKKHPEFTLPVRIGREAKISLLELAIFTRQFAALIDAGVPVQGALEGFISQEMTGPALLGVLDQVAYKVQSGTRLSQAFRMYPTVFSGVYWGLVETAERTGQLADTLNRLADLLEKQYRVRQRLISVLTYPAVICAFALVSLGTYVIFILPMVQQLLEGLRVEIPWITKVIIKSRYVLPGLLITVGWLALLWRLTRNTILRKLDQYPAIKQRIHRTLYQIPLIGPVLLKITVTRLILTLASQIDSGLGLVEAIHGLQAVANNAWVIAGLRKVEVDIRGGASLGMACKEAGIFPNMVLDLLFAGEEVAGIPAMLRYAAKLMEESTEIAILTMAVTLEPILMLGMGLVVGILILGTMLPIVRLVQNL